RRRLWRDPAGHGRCSLRAPQGALEAPRVGAGPTLDALRLLLALLYLGEGLRFREHWLAVPLTSLDGEVGGLVDGDGDRSGAVTQRCAGDGPGQAVVVLGREDRVLQGRPRDRQGPALVDGRLLHRVDQDVGRVEGVGVERGG